MYPHKAESMNKKLKALLAEDDDSLREKYKREMEQEGLHVTCVDNGQALIERAEKEEFDIIVSDTDMPQLDGDKACKKIRESIHYRIFIIGMSDAHENEDYWVNIADWFIYKPNLASVSMGKVVRTKLERFNGFEK